MEDIYTHMENKVTATRVVVIAFAATTLLLLPPFGGGAAPPPEAAAAAAAAATNCTRICGDISIPYPFGLEPGCYHAAGFKLSCRYDDYDEGLFLGDGSGGDVQVLEISLEHSTVRINSNVDLKLPYGEDFAITNITWGLGLPLPEGFFLSEWNSMLLAVGCNVTVSILGGVNRTLLSSCTAICSSGHAPAGRICTGLGCCQASIVAGYSFYTIQVEPISNSWNKNNYTHSSSDLLPGTTVSAYTVDYGVPGGNGVYGDTGNNRHSDLIPSTSVSAYIVDYGVYRDTDGYASLDSPEWLRATLDWIISSSTCPADLTAAPECVSANSYCQNHSFLEHVGYVCQCSEGYEGNPYVHGGCTDIDECKDRNICYGNCTNIPAGYTCQCGTGYTGDPLVPNGCTDIDECEHHEAYPCYGICQNLPGSFHCHCPEGTYGNPSIKGGCITIKNSLRGLSIGLLGVAGGIILLLLSLGVPYILRKIKLQKVKNMKRKFFKQNHGLLLQQLISHNTDISERMIITLSGIEKATNNFDIARIIGGGGHGVVFKGILDLHVVAIKKSKIVVQREINEFINEVAVLSQVNHRNVVKLLGCCLETEVPLLVYEFISNGTLCHHLHIDSPISLPWDDRMRIATEVAKAISYLHSAASMPIFHRDIKSANILLDDALTAKVSDFGASRYIPTDQTGVTTAVQGTMGYLDPMYYYTGRLTDKSDVFSFGVLLIELLTRKKPYVYRSVDDDGLVSHFVSLFNDGKLVDIIDPQVMEEEGPEIQEVATLATMCTKLKGEDRPTMREVEMTLESLLVKKRHAQFNGTPMRNGRDEATTRYVATNRDSKETSRQYTMEEEIRLSANYPR